MRLLPGALLWALLLRPAAAIAGQSAPPMPQRLVDYCEGESCHFGCRVLIRRPVLLRQMDERAAPESGQLNPGDTALVATGNLWIRRPGIVVLLRDTVLATDDGEPRRDTMRLARGDTLYVLEYGELGYWHWWFGGRRGGGMEFWNGPAQAYFGPGRAALAALSSTAPEVERWLRLDGAGGGGGWWRAEPDHLELLPGEDTYCALP